MFTDGSAAPVAAPTNTYQPDFRADGKEYFRIWIVNLALTIVTVGIYSAWAKVRKLRYFYSNTSLAGSAFGYHAEPLKILKGRLIAAAIGIIYFGSSRISPFATLTVFALIALAMPWLVVRSRMFAMRMTSWRGIRFGFDQDYRGAYWSLLGVLVLGIASLGILVPLAACERYRFVITRSRFGNTNFACAPSVGRFYRTALGVIGLIVLWGVLLIGVAMAWKMTNPGAGLAGHFPKPLIPSIMLVTYLLFFVVFDAYTKSRNLNEVFGKTSLGTVKVNCRLRAFGLMKIYLVNIIGIVCTLGLYTPWAQVRLARYRLGAMNFEVEGSLDQFVAAAGATAPGAAGEEISELFDVDFGF